VESVACPDDRTAVITLKEPSPAFLVDLVVMRIVPRSTIPQTAAMWKHPIGTGPFQWKSDDDRDVILSRYDNYWGNKPQYSTLRFRTYTDPQSRLLALKKGDIDIAINSLPANLMDSAASDPSIGIEGDDGITYQFISINHRNPILKKKQVRQALMYGIDREAIIRLKLKDQAKLANNLLPGKSFFAFRENPYPYNPAKSAALLKQLGYSPEKPLKLELKTSTDAQIVSVGLIIKEQLKKVGFDIELKSLEWGTFYDDIKKGNFDLHVSRWTGILDPNCYYDFLHSSQVPPGKNRGAYSNKEFDAWTEKGRTSFDLNDRKKIYTKVQEIFADDVPYVSLWHYKSVGVFRKDRISQLSVPPNGSFDCLANVIKKP
jgi:peptide/nickel transport system substrate-binding protein